MPNKNMVDVKKLKTVDYEPNDYYGVYHSIMDLIKIIITKNNEVDFMRHEIYKLWYTNYTLKCKLSTDMKIIPLNEGKTKALEIKQEL